MSANCFVPLGTPSQASGGETFAPSAVYFLGIGWPSANAELEMLKSIAEPGVEINRHRRGDRSRVVARDNLVGGVDEPVAVVIVRVRNRCGVENRVWIVAGLDFVAGIDQGIHESVARLAGGIAKIEHVGFAEARCRRGL